VVNPFSNLTDEELMELYLKDEHLAFEVIYARYKSNVFSYLSKRLKDSRSVEEIFQNTFIKFHRFRKKYDSKYPLLAWIYTLTKNEMLDYIKKNKVQLVGLKEVSVEIIESNKDLLQQIDLQSLSQNEKDAIKLRYYEDKDFKEISKLLNTSQSNSRKIISRAIKKLKRKYSRPL
jgi:RNA polymerase sigma-70 factor (ECF subfamily)